MESIKALRQAADELADRAMPCDNSPDYVGVRWRVTQLADAIEREVGDMQRALTIDAKPMTDENMAESGWVRLPVDTEGVPIHVGDKLEFVSYGGTKTEYTALGYWYDFDCDVLQVLVSNSHAISGNCLRHHHAPTVEDVLREFAAQVTNGQRIHGAIEIEQAVAECAAKLRLAEGSE